MSDHMKKRHTEISIDGKIYLLPDDKKESVFIMLEALGIKLKHPTDILAKDLLAPLYKKLPKGAIHLRTARTKEGLSQKDLMNKTGIPVYNISKMENGSRPIGSKLAAKIAKALKINIKLLLQE